MCLVIAEFVTRAAVARDRCHCAEAARVRIQRLVGGQVVDQAEVAGRREIGWREVAEFARHYRLTLRLAVRQMHARAGFDRGEHDHLFLDVLEHRRVERADFLHVADLLGRNVVTLAVGGDRVGLEDLHVGHVAVEPDVLLSDPLDAGFVVHAQRHRIELRIRAVSVDGEGLRLAFVGVGIVQVERRARARGVNAGQPAGGGKDHEAESHDGGLHAVSGATRRRNLPRGLRAFDLH
ncbi:hypothetical protein OKW38_003678 [Paraburkholderia sp. MM5496-R1]